MFVILSSSVMFYNTVTLIIMSNLLRTHQKLKELYVSHNSGDCGFVTVSYH